MSEWLDTPEGQACVKATSAVLAEKARLKPGGECVRYTRIVLAAALDVRVECEECKGDGKCHSTYHLDALDCGLACPTCGGAGTVPVLYHPRGEKP